MTREEYDAAMLEACPHGPDEPCTEPHHLMGCTCDIAWDTIAELRMEYLS